MLCLTRKTECTSLFHAGVHDSANTVEPLNKDTFRTSCCVLCIERSSSFRSSFLYTNTFALPCVGGFVLSVCPYRRFHCKLKISGRESLFVAID